MVVAPVAPAALRTAGAVLFAPERFALACFADEACASNESKYDLTTPSVRSWQQMNEKGRGRGREREKGGVSALSYHHHTVRRRKRVGVPRFLLTSPRKILTDLMRPRNWFERICGEDCPTVHLVFRAVACVANIRSVTSCCKMPSRHKRRRVSLVAPSGVFPVSS
jgi:hypothetical protein